jgi:HEAT repeat protein
VTPVLLLSLLVFAQAEPAAEVVPPSDAAALTAELLTRKDDVDPELVRRLSNLRTKEALDGLTRFYDAVESLYMRRIALHGFALFDGIAELEQDALQKLTDVATLAKESELRETAVDELGRCQGGRRFLAAIVDSTADDAVRERALRVHASEPRGEDVEWYLGIYRSDATKAKDKEREKRSKGKDERPPEPLYTPYLKALAYEGLVSARSVPELVTDTEAGIADVRRRALEELVARRAKEAPELAERVLEARGERPDVRLFAAEVLLDERGPKFAESLYKLARRGVPLELAFGLADLLAEVDDASLRAQVVRNLGQGQEQEQRFHLRIAARIPDPKVDKALLELSKEKARDVAVDALRAMGTRGNPTFLPRLQEVLRSERDPARLTAAIEARSGIQGTDPAWRAELDGLTTHAEAKVRNAALEALGASQDPARVPVLVRALEHPDWSTRLVAAQGLERLRTVEGVGALCRRIPHEDGRLAAEFAEMLWRLTAKPFRGDTKQWARWWEEEGANFRFPTPEELQKRQRERELRADKEVTRSFRGVKVESRFFGLRIESHHVAFVVDVSGSMEWRLGGERATEGPKRLEVAKRELLACLEALESGTRFNILPFSSDVSPWHEGAVECTEETFAQATEFITELGARGGTNIYAGLRQAFADPEVDTIFFLSDGEPSQGEVVDTAAIREAVRGWNDKRGVVVHTISIGERFPLLEWLAVDSGGVYRTYP